MTWRRCEACGKSSHVMQQGTTFDGYRCAEGQCQRKRPNAHEAARAAARERRTQA